MTDYHKLVPIPARRDINSGLSSCKQSTMLTLFGRPGRLTQDCSPVTNEKLKDEIVTQRFNNFSVTGWKPAVSLLQKALLEVYQTNPALHSVIRTAGMLCCRAVRKSSEGNFSNHSWGCAIDIKIESELDELGKRVVQQGILDLYPYLHRHGFYWGAGFSRPDVMHFELADQTVRRLFKEIRGKHGSPEGH